MALLIGIGAAGCSPSAAPPASPTAPVARTPTTAVTAPTNAAPNAGPPSATVPAGTPGRRRGPVRATVGTADPAWVLAHAKGLKLTPAQTASLKRVNGTYRQQLDIDVTAQKEAAAVLQRATQQAVRSAHPDLRALRRRAQPVAAAEQRADLRKQQGWDQAMAVLSAEQRAVAVRLLSRRAAAKP